MTEVRNKLLRLIPPDELSHIIRFCDRVELKRHQVLHHYRLPMEYVYFVESGLVSVAALVGRETFVEVWLIGSEGLVGAPVLLAANSVPLHRRIVQVGGRALRIKTDNFSAILRDLPHLRSVVERYLAAVLVQTSQSGACNSYHGVKQRLARWLLVAREALGADKMPLTHTMLADLLGIRRASVTESLELLHEEGTISTKRGWITVEDPAELSKLSCGCFGLIEYEYRHHLHPADHAGRGAAAVPIPASSPGQKPA